MCKELSGYVQEGKNKGCGMGTREENYQCPCGAERRGVGVVFPNMDRVKDWYYEA